VQLALLRWVKIRTTDGTTCQHALGFHTRERCSGGCGETAAVSCMDRLAARPKVHETLKAEGRHRVPASVAGSMINATLLRQAAQSRRASEGTGWAVACGFQVRPERGECPVAFSIRLPCCIWLQATRFRRIGPNGSSPTAGRSAIQLLNEIAILARRIMPMSWKQTNGFLAIMRSLLPVVPVTVDSHETGIDPAEGYGFPIYVP
jgi:hypothetical protein